MIARPLPHLVLAMFCAIVVGMSPSAGTRGEDSQSTFGEVLALADINSEQLLHFGASGIYDAGDWQLIQQLLYRLKQYPDSQLEKWVQQVPLQPGAEALAEAVGSMVDVSGTITDAEEVPLPPGDPAGQDLPKLYRCRFRQAVTNLEATVLTPRLPFEWHDWAVSDEPVRLRGILLFSSTAEPKPVLLTERIAWYPLAQVSPGKLLLARNGMDVALLDEVKHRLPFVKRSTSREGEAFYACMAALDKADPMELYASVSASVFDSAAHWKKLATDAASRQQSLEQQLAATDDASQDQKLNVALETTRRVRSIAEVVEQQAGKELSSLAPLLLLPEDETGQLVRIEGTARRAIRITAPQRDDIREYYEVEVYTSESQYLHNLPVVCCVHELPADFPTGDILREPVRIEGVFFKNWRYRSRESVEITGQTTRPRPLYTPLIVSPQLTWLQQSAKQPQSWGLAAGVFFLVLLAAVCLLLTILARSDRRASGSRPGAEHIEL